MARKRPRDRPAAVASPPAAEPVTGGPAAAAGPGDGTTTRSARDLLAAAARELDEADRAVYAAIAATPTPLLDKQLRRLSQAANRSAIWLAIAAAIAASGGQRGRRAAGTGVLAVGVTSATVNLVVKFAYQRQRPDRSGLQVPLARWVRMPSSTSFPSGHSASGFAFATAVGHGLPPLALPLRFLAGAVAYSRVHTGVHYPGDVVIGSVVGAAIGRAVAGLTRSLTAARRR